MATLHTTATAYSDFHPNKSTNRDSHADGYCIASGRYAYTHIVANNWTRYAHTYAVTDDTHRHAYASANTHQPGH
jgi:hypothetical protein